MKARLLEQNARRRIFDLVQRAPGTHLRALARELGMALGTLEHHVHQLERNGLIASILDGHQRLFFARDAVDVEDVACLRLLRHPVAGRLLAELALEPEVARQALVERLPHDGSTVSYHLRRLREAGLVDRITIGRKQYYRATDPERVARLLLQHPSGAPDVSGSESFGFLLERTPRRDGARTVAPAPRR